MQPIPERGIETNRERKRDRKGGRGKEKNKKEVQKKEKLCSLKGTLKKCIKAIDYSLYKGITQSYHIFFNPSI